MRLESATRFCLCLGLMTLLVPQAVLGGEWTSRATTISYRVRCLTSLSPVDRCSGQRNRAACRLGSLRRTSLRLLRSTRQ